MALHARWIYNNLVYWDTHQNRIVDAWGPGVRKVVLEGPNWPLSAAETLVGWTTTLVEGGGGDSTITATQVAGGALLLTTDAAENDGINVQMQGEAFQPAADTFIYFGVKLQISDATQSDFFAGLSITATDILGGVSDSIGFRKVDATTTVTALMEQDTVEVEATAHTLVAATDVTLEFICNGVTVDFWVNGTQLASQAQTSVPDDELLSPAIHFLTGSANVRTCQIAWLRCFRIAAA